MPETAPSLLSGIDRYGELSCWSPTAAALPADVHLLVTTRHGGVSAAPWDSLNLSPSTGDDRDDVDTNRQRLREATQIPTWHWLHQVHGNLVVEAAKLTAIPGGTLQADGLWTADRAVALAVAIADCVPVFLWDRSGERLAIVHAGWRGTAQAIVQNGIDCLVGAGSQREDLCMALGPCIGPCCYEVDEEVLRQLPQSAQQRRADGNFADLRAANRSLARESGIPADQIAADPPCTVCHTQHFFSHRRQGPATGRMWAVAWLDSL